MNKGHQTALPPLLSQSSHPAGTARVVIQYLLQLHPEKIITTAAFLLLRLHQNSPRNQGITALILANPPPSEYPKRQHLCGSGRYFRGDYVGAIPVLSRNSHCNCFRAVAISWSNTATLTSGSRLTCGKSGERRPPIKSTRIVALICFPRSCR
ncbi:hypothetical protein SAMN05216315_101134 [Nitrosospira sp. Nsp18]|nr:hypothetical protein SAMN05216315_101134 [Nitrosospira sp. Nsp18]